MKIEDYWSDIDIYFISFIAKIDNQKIKIERLIVIDSDLDEKDVKTYVLNYFNNVDSIETIDLWHQGLLKNDNY